MADDAASLDAHTSTRPTSSKTLRASILLISNGLTQVASLATMIWLARVLNVADNGTYRQLLLLSSLLIPILTGPLTTSMTYLLSRAKDDSQALGRILHQTICLSVLSGVVACCILYLVRVPLGQAFHNSSIESVMLAFVAYPFFSITVAFVVPFLVERHRAMLASIVSSLNAILIASFVIAAGAFSEGLSGVVLALSLATTVGAAITLSIVLAAYPKVLCKPIQFQAAGFEEQLKFALPVFLSSLLYLSGLRINQFLVSAQLSPEAFAIYTVGATEIPLVGMIQGAVASVLFPELSRMAQEGDRIGIIGQWQSAINKTSAVFFPLACILLLASSTLINLLFSSKYQASIPIFQVFLMLIPLRMIPFSLLLKAFGQPHRETWGAGLFLLLNVALGWPMLCWWGGVGAATSLVCSMVILTSLYLKWTTTVTGIALHQLWPKVIWYNCLKAVFAFLMAQGVVDVLQPWLGAMSLWLGILIYGLVYVWLGGLKAVLPRNGIFDRMKC